MTTGDFYCDEDFFGRSWVNYPLERLEGMEGDFAPPAERWDLKTAYPARDDPARDLHGLARAARGRACRAEAGQPRVRAHLAVGAGASAPAGQVRHRLGPGARAARRAAGRSLHDGQAQGALVGRVGGHEQRAADAGGRLAARSSRSRSRTSTSSTTRTTRRNLDFLVDAFNREVEDLDDVEVWVHTCFGNPNMQRVFETTRYSDEGHRDLPRAAER